MIEELLAKLDEEQVSAMHPFLLLMLTSLLGGGRVVLITSMHSKDTEHIGLLGYNCEGAGVLDGMLAGAYEASQALAEKRGTVQ